MFLFDKVLLEGVFRMDRFVGGGGVFPSILQNDLLATWMKL